ncbi:hypothetical protein AUP68_00264 [Ilyonectria robusta]
MSPWTWPLWWRILILLNVSFYNLLGNAFAAGVPPLFELIIKEFHCTQAEASQLSTYVLLTLGLSNIFALPAASLIGKRYTILLSLVLFLATNIWSAEAPSYSSLRASRLLGGLAGGLIEALGPTIVAETFPQHQLARAMVVYVGFLAAGSALGPVVAGAVAQGVGDWRWYQRILAVAVGLNLMSSIFMLPETTHNAMGISGPVAIVEDDAKPEETSVEYAEPPGHQSEAVVEGSPTRMWLRTEWMKRSFSSHYVEMNWRDAILRTIQPLELIAAPQVLVTTFVFGLTIGWTVIISILVATVYAQPPLLWNSLNVGLLSIAPLVGLLVGLPIGGLLADFLSNRAEKSSRGHDPATRLPSVLLGALISPTGCLVLGYGLRRPETWIQVCIGWAMLSLGLTSSANVLLTYAVDCLPSRAGHIGALVNLTKNCVAFGVSYASVSWMQSMGPVNQFAVMAGLLWLAYLFVIPVWLFSNRLARIITKLA